MDAAEIVSQLRAGHAGDAQTRIGVDVIAGAVGDMSQLGIYEAFKVQFASFHSKLCMPLMVLSACCTGQLLLYCCIGQAEFSFIAPAKGCQV